MNDFSGAGMNAFSGAATGASLGGPLGAAVGAGAGLGKYFLFDKPAQRRKLQLAAHTQALSPWTGLRAEVPAEIDPFSNAMAFGATGAQMGQGMQAQSAQAELQNRYLSILENQQPQRQPAALNFGTTAHAAPSMSPWDWGTTPDQMQQLYGVRR